MSKQKPSKPRVALFVTCLVDLYRPSVGFAAVKLLEDAGCEVEVPISQTCCGQPAWNSGDRADTKELARNVIETFEGYDYVVAPSGSCAGMLKRHYPEVFAGDVVWEERAKAFGSRVYELISFLVDVMGMATVEAKLDATVTYHDSCAGLRELNICEQPRKLISSIDGVEMKEMHESNVCCGFGGTFAVKYSEISNSIVTTKADNIIETGADMLLAGDMGCLLNMAGKLSRKNSDIEVRHVAEVLAGMTDNPPIGQKKSKFGDK